MEWSAFLSWRVSLDPSHVLPWVWQEVKGEALSDDHCWNLLAAGPRGRREDVEWVWFCEGCVAAPIHEMRLAVLLADLCSGFVECVFSVAM